jgi:DNA-binding CsgD family transcriptional regulator
MPRSVNECVECGHLQIHHPVKPGGAAPCTWGECKCSGMVIGLTPREVQILKLFAAGHGIKDVAQILKNSPKTIESHRYNMCVKTGLHSMLNLILLALRTGLVKLEDLPGAKRRMVTLPTREERQEEPARLFGPQSWKLPAIEPN